MGTTKNFYFKTIILVFFFILNCQLLARPVETFYGVIEVDEPVVLELIDSRPMQRLKAVHQYGISYYTTHREEFTRYDHSLGVLAILRMQKVSLEEQIAGLLHDVSHTVFSHVGDYVFNQKKHQKGYQDDIHAWFLEESGIGKILKKHDFSIAQVLPKSENFKALEQPLPNLCADRIDYNLQGAFHRGFLTKKEVLEIVKDLIFDGEKWIATKPELMVKMVRFSLHMTKNCWGSPTNFVMSSWFSEVIRRAVQLGKITEDDIHFGLDHVVWRKIRQLKDPLIQNRFRKIFNAKHYFALVDPKEADLHPKMKFRGVDPWIKKEGQVHRLTSLDEKVKEEFHKIQEEMAKGWPIKIKPDRKSIQIKENLAL
ncbi:MAG: hypothetical protein K940chlam6_01523 [Chlamydiae bacterium]|nr:hypothetical protein [Chlamydiota bacterium]